MSLEWIAILVPILCAVITGLVGIATTQALGRLSDRIDSAQREIGEHKENDHEQFNYHGNLLHWMANCVQVVVLQMAIDGKAVKLPERPER